jgi:diguanylate cyclase (GGDEF)-like protein
MFLDLTQLLRHCGALLLFATFALPALALDPALQMTQYVHRSWSSNDGLPQDSINGIAQTRDGYLWMATQEGLARFDGVEFVTFDARNTGGVVGNFMYTVFVDRNGTLWAGGGDGLIRYDGNGRFSKFVPAGGWPGTSAKYISEDTSGNLWIGLGTDSPNEGRGMVRYRDNRAQLFTTRDGLASNQVYETAAAADGSIWIGTSAGLNVMRDGRITLHEFSKTLPDQKVRVLLIDRRNALWAGTPNGLARIERGKVSTFKKDDGLPSNDILSLYEDGDGVLWVGTGAGLARFSHDRFETGAKIAGVADDAIFAIFEDREKNLWIGTHVGGLHKLRGAKFTPYGPPEGLVGENVHAILEDRTGNIWVGTSPGGVSIIEGGAGGKVALPAEVVQLDARSIHQSRDGSMWLGSRNELLSISAGKVTHHGVRNGLPSADVKIIFEDRKGTLWFGTENGLGSFDGKRFSAMKMPADAPQVVRIIHEDRGGRLWIGGSDGFGYFENGRYTAMTRHEAPYANVQAVLEDREGTMWFTTWGQGLFSWRDGVLENYVAAQGLFDDVAWSVLEDDHGNLWLGSNRGIFRVAKKALHDLAAKRSAKVGIRVFGTVDGMRKRETNAGGRSAIRTRDGRLWFGTTAGVVMVNPQRLPTNTLPPPVVIEHFVANEKLVAAAGLMNLAPGTLSIEIQYAGLSLVAPERVRYRYRLEGFDDHWIDASTRHKAFYTNIDPGLYRFHVTAANDDGVWNDEGTSIEFRLRPYFYQSPWFILLVVVAVLLLGAALKALRERQQRIRHQVYHDPLTGLPNRILLAERAAVALTLAARRNHSIAVLFLDLDGFKQVNDRFGHAAGDELLQQVANRFRACIREIDTLARIGGDEFAVLVADLDDEGRAAEVAARMIAAMAESFSVDQEKITLGVSIGIAVHPFDGTEIKSILQAADRAMYRAKLSGGNAYQFNAADVSETVKI